MTKGRMRNIIRGNYIAKKKRHLMILAHKFQGILRNQKASQSRKDCLRRIKLIIRSYSNKATTLQQVLSALKDHHQMKMTIQKEKSQE